MGACQSKIRKPFQSINDKYFEFHNASLKNVLDQLASYYKVQVYNPKQLKGQNIEAGLLKSSSLKYIISLIAEYEAKYNVYVYLKNGVIYVSGQSNWDGACST